MDKISMITLLLARAYTDKKTSEVPAVIQYKGVTTTALSDGATTNPITINGSSYTAVNGDTVFYDGVAYTFDGTVWQETISLAQIITELEGLDEKIGDLTDLTTTDKDSVVDAINELVTAVGGKQDTLTFDDTPTDNSNNPVKSNGVYDALALKQDKTDNSLQTTDKTVVGAVNELKSGFTNLDNEVNGDATVYPYADVITIPDAIPANLADCTVKIEPVQDLHGYDHPWVGGAGKNKCKSRSASATSNGVEFTLNDDGTVTANRTSTSENNAYVVLPSVTLPAGTYKFSGCNGGFDTGYWIDFSYNSTSHRQYTEELTATFTEETTVTPWLNVYASYNAQNKVFSPMIRIDGTTSTYEPYENICPITGHTEASVQRDGKNLAENNLNTSSALAGVTFTKNPDGSMYCSGTISNTGYIRQFNANLNLQVGQTYTISGMDSTIGIRLYFLYKDQTEISRLSCYGSPVTFEVPQNTVTTTANIITGSKDSVVDVTVYPQIEIGSTATPYVPYAGKTYTIALGDTIYGGTVDFDSGVMTVIRVKTTVDDLEWTKYNVDQGTLFRGALSNIKQVADGYELTSVISSAYPAVANNDRTDKTLSQGPGISAVDIIDDDYANAAYFKTAMSDVEICYELATPTTIQLTPQQIQLLKGTNTLTASTGQISVTVNGVSGAIGQGQEQVNELAEDVADIAEKLPTAPTTDGAYVLTVTVADGTPTYSWESAT